MNKIKKIYDSLLKEYGHQGWWPVTPVDCHNSIPVDGIVNRNEKHKFEIMVGSILTQAIQNCSFFILDTLVFMTSN
jgi:endonuclease III-like uncharacterized protein